MDIHWSGGCFLYPAAGGEELHSLETRPKKPLALEETETFGKFSDDFRVGEESPSPSPGFDGEESTTWNPNWNGGDPAVGFSDQPIDEAGEDVFAWRPEQDAPWQFDKQPADELLAASSSLGDQEASWGLPQEPSSSSQSQPESESIFGVPEEEAWLSVDQMGDASFSS
ncbi:MAG: hypothetical protein Q8P67_23385, partial [archaeon]|nr:hypothetical protein [archaeon]